MTNSEARKRQQGRRPCPTCSGPTRETAGMICQTCGTDYAPHPAMSVAVETFSAAWETAHAAGWSGHRVEAGLRALMAAGWTPPPVVLCPECDAGKHVNCDGRALNPVTDELTACGCPCTDQGGTL